MLKIFTILSVALFTIDRVLKYYVQNLSAGEVFASGGIFEFGYFLNPSLFFLPAWNFIPWVALAVLVTLTILVLFSQLKSTLIPNSYFLIPILLGGASNVFDRFAYGGVIDYARVADLATVNLADVLILAGLIVLLKKYSSSPLNNPIN